MMSPCSSRNVGDRGAVAGDQRRRRQLREFGDEQFLRRVPHVRRVVDDERLRMNALEKMRRGDVAHVEGRILTEMDHVERREIDRLAGSPSVK